MPVTLNSRLNLNDASGGDAIAPADRVDAAIVANQAARLALAPDDVQPLDLVQQTDTGALYVLLASDPSQAGSWARLPGNDASLITTGTLDSARLPTVPVSKGGTAADLSSTGGSGQVLKQSSSGGAITVGVLTASEMGAIYNASYASTYLQYRNSSGKLVDSGLVAAGSNVALLAGYLDVGSGIAPTSSAYGIGYETNAFRLQCGSVGGLRVYSSTTCLANITTAGLAIGKGTSTPTRFLEVYNAATYQMRLNNPTAGESVDMGVDNSGNTRINWSSVTAPLSLVQAGTVLANLGSTGFAIGKGSTAATTPLHVAGTSGQLTLEYGTGFTATQAVDANGHLSITHTGNRLGIGYTPTVSANYSTGVGYGPTASGTSSLALGHGPTASGTYSIAAGYAAASSGSGSVAAGYLSACAGDAGVALGRESSAPGHYSVAIGYSADTTTAKVSAIAIGHGATSSANQSVAIGYNPTASSDYSIAMGYSAVAAGQYSVAIGLQSATNDTGSIAIGYLATPSGQLGVSIGSNSSSVSGGVALGYAATAAQGIALGNNSSCGGANQIAAGYAASTNDAHSVALGSVAASTGQFSAAIGGSSSASTGGVALGYATAGNYGVSLGYGATAGANEIALGSATHTKFGIMGATPVGRGSAWSITNAAGARRTFDTSTVTLPQLAEVVATLLSHLGDYAGFGFLDTNY